NLYGSFLRVQSREDEAITHLTQSLKIARDHGLWEQQSDALVCLGHNYWQKGDFKKASEYQLENIGLSRKMGDSMRVGNSYIGLGSINAQQGAYTKAMTYYTMASERFKESDDLRGYRVAIGNIGYIQRSLGNYDSAIEYYRKSDSISRILDDVTGKAFANYNLSVVYKNTGQLDSALLYNTRGRELYQKLGQRKRVSYCYFTLGEIHKKKGDFPDALKAYQESLNLSRAIDDSVQIGYSSMAVADMYDTIGNSVQSIAFLDISKKVAQRMQLDILAMDVHERLAERMAKSGNLGGAYENLQRFIVLKDSLYTKEKRELGSEIEAKYQNEQQSREIALLASEKELQALQLSKRKNERNGIIAVAVFMLLVAGLLYNQYRIKQRDNKELQELDELKSNFFANISHEFRTPLTLIK
ncbi:MAG: tetratricopeptide repeat protein, partial [Bacteroidota bacterium]